MIIPEYSYVGFCFLYRAVRMREMSLCRIQKIWKYRVNSDYESTDICGRNRRRHHTFLFERKRKLCRVYLWSWSEKDRNGEAGSLYDDVWIIVRDMEHFNQDLFYFRGIVENESVKKTFNQTSLYSRISFFWCARKGICPVVCVWQRRKKVSVWWSDRKITYFWWGGIVETSLPEYLKSIIVPVLFLNR